MSNGVSFEPILLPPIRINKNEGKGSLERPQLIIAHMRCTCGSVGTVRARRSEAGPTEEKQY